MRSNKYFKNEFISKSGNIDEVTLFKKWELSNIISNIMLVLFFSLLFKLFFDKLSYGWFWAFIIIIWFLSFLIFVLFPIYLNVILLKSIKKVRFVIIYALSLISYHLLSLNSLLRTILYRIFNYDNINDDMFKWEVSRKIHDYEFISFFSLAFIALILFLATIEFRSEMNDSIEDFKKRYKQYKKIQRNNIKTQKNKYKYKDNRKYNKYGAVIPNSK